MGNTASCRVAGKTGFAVEGVHMTHNHADLAVTGAPAGIRLVAFDLDGTLTRGQTCMEAIADALGFADQMATWEQARTNGGFRHVFPATKPTLLAQHARALGIPPHQVAAVGDSPGAKILTGVRTGGKVISEEETASRAP